MSESLEQEIRALQSLFWSDRDPDGRGFAALADAFRRSGDPRRALDLLADGLARLPDFVPGHVVAARLYVERGLLAEGELAARRALEMDPDNVDALGSLAVALDGSDRGREAVELRDRVAVLEPPIDGFAGGSPEAVFEVLDAEGVEDEPAMDFGALAPDEPVMDLGALAPDEPVMDLGALAPDEPVTELSALAPDEPVMDFGALAPDEEPAAEGEAVLDFEMLAPDEPVMELDTLAPDESVMDLGALAPDEPVMDFGALAPDEEPAAEGEAVLDFEMLAPDEPVMELDTLAPDESVMDLGALAPDEPVMDFGALAPDGEAAAEAGEAVLDFEMLAPDEPVMELDTLAPDESVMDLGALAPDEPVMDFGALAPDGEPAAEAGEAVLDFDTLAPDEPVMELDTLAPDEPVMDLGVPAPDETVLEFDALAPEGEPVAVEGPAIDFDLSASVGPAGEDALDVLPPGEPIFDERLVDPFLPPDLAQAADADEEDASAADGDEEEEPVFTRTLAELYARQGFSDRALEVLRHLSAESPGDQSLRDRIAEIEGGVAPAPQASTRVALATDALADELDANRTVPPAIDTPFAWTEATEERPGNEGQSVRAYFDGLLNWPDGGEA